MNGNPQLEELDSGNKADVEPEAEEGLWELNLLITSINKLDVNTSPMMQASGTLMNN